MRLHVERTTASQPSVRRRRRAARQSGGSLGVHGDALPQLDGGLAVRDADEREPHEAKWVRGRTIATSANPATSRNANRRAVQAHLPAQDQASRVEHPDGDRDRHRDVEVASVEAAEPDENPGRQDDERDRAVRAERRSSDSSGGRRRRSRLGVALLQTALLPEVEARQPGRHREACEPGEHEADVERKEPARRVFGRDSRSAAGPRGDEKRRRERHDGEPEEPVARRAAPDEVRADHEPDEQVERARPRSPGESVAVERLRDEERGLREPAHPDAPDGEAGGVDTRPRRTPAYATAASP